MAEGKKIHLLIEAKTDDTSLDRSLPLFQERVQADLAIQVVRYQRAGEAGLELFYWREGTDEVDYVLQKGKRLAAIEVKSGRQREAASGLSEFQKRYSPYRIFVVGTSGIPLEEFLCQDPLRLFQ